ncbi:acyl-CoA thioesterase [Priestia koreensis]|uniref:acyl-CoA thioesterase n=1 Tax=Priestia koreensis TaxID=284581 RepID=UPI001F58478B|nr:thioesterase family protein [Priestia koreensis]MCM3005349.1 acyl-CoA thioesterase [Priestia koreensis]UNL86563.1 acyl-CoA thioesterase [Priestia koreensis]
MKHLTSITTRLQETDALGHINNISYFIYFEEARIDFFKTLGFADSASNWHYILASTQCNFRGQTYFDEKITIETTVKNIGNTSMNLHHVIRREETGEVLADGQAIVVYFNFIHQKSERIPEGLRQMLARYDYEDEPLEKGV